MTDREILLDVLARVAGLEVALERLAPAPKISRKDRRAMLVLLPMLQAMHGVDPFTAAAALETATLRGLTAWPTSAMAMGRLFGRAQGVLINGLCIEPHGRAAGNSALWAIRSLGLPTFNSDFKAA